MAKKGKIPSPKAAKQRAGVILSSILREVAEEETELGFDQDGDPKMITKAEALARLVWKKALGYIEKRTSQEGADEILVEHPPDRVYVTMLFDRLEGRVAAVEPGKKEKRTVADKVGEQSKKRINALSKKMKNEK